MSLREMFSNLTHQFLGMVHKTAPTIEEPCLESSLSVTSAGGHGTGEQGLPGEDRDICYCLWSPGRDPEQGARGRGVDGERRREGQRFLPGLQATSPDTRGQ